MDRIGRNQGAPLPWLWLQRMTNGRVTPAQDQAVADGLVSGLQAGVKEELGGIGHGGVVMQGATPIH